MISKRLYLGGCLSYYYKSNQLYKATEWRSKLIKRLLDDIADKGENCWSWFDPTHNFEENFKNVNNSSVLAQNDYYLDNSDIMVVNLSELSESPGTVYEIIYYGLKGKPIIATGWNDWAKSPHIEPFLTCILKNEEDIVEYLNAMYYQ